MSGSTFIQWKETDLCMDFHCPKCGEHSHFDGLFAYAVRCSACGQDWQMPTDVSSLLFPLAPGHGEMIVTDNLNE